MKPVIGINCELEELRKRERAMLCDDYVKAVVEAGGVPVILPHLQTREEWMQVLDRLDGVILSGGSDLQPSLYGQERHPALDPVLPRKQSADWELVHLLLARPTPVLGICYGEQLLAVARGGSLVQDIPSQVAHAVEHREGAKHEVSLDAGSRLRDILGVPRATVNSFHHQSVDRPGEGLRVVSRSGDGVIEALELEGHPFCIAVQWHPERMPDSSEQRRVFSALLDAARKA